MRTRMPGRLVNERVSLAVVPGYTLRHSHAIPFHEKLYSLFEQVVSKMVDEIKDSGRIATGNSRG
jgi:hypothetical protein